MAQPSDTLKIKYGYFHANGKTLSEEGQYTFESPYGSGHVMYPKDIFAQALQFCSTEAEADAYVAANPTIVKKYTQYSLTQVAYSNGQSWYISDGGQWMRPIIVGTQAPHATTNAASDGYIIKLYKSTGVEVGTTTGIWWVDPFQGLVKFAAGSTPTVLSYGVPKITCYVYTGRTLTNVLNDLGTGEGREFVYTSSTPATTHNITHNLGSLNLETEVLGYETEAGGWTQQLAPVVMLDNNTARVDLTESMNVRVLFRHIGA